MNRRTAGVPVRGGQLAVGIWESPDVASGAEPTRTILAVHGVTSSQLAWSLIADRLVAGTGTRVVAPDLRGRGRSSDLPGPWGMAQHADDLLAVCDVFGIPQVTTGHSMGAFVAVVFAARHPSSAGRLVLVDGGVPLQRPAGMSIDAVLAATLGPAAARLQMTFADRDEYRRYWQGHPAFAGCWSPAVQDYVDYDLVRGADGWHSSSRYAAVAADTLELSGQSIVSDSWPQLRGPVVLLHSSLGLLAQPPGLYAPSALAAFASRHPGLQWSDLPGTNHYTVTLGDVGAAQVARTITEVAQTAVEDGTERADSVVA